MFVIVMFVIVLCLLKSLKGLQMLMSCLAQIHVLTVHGPF